MRTTPIGSCSSKPSGSAVCGDSHVGVMCLETLVQLVDYCTEASAASTAETTAASAVFTSDIYSCFESDTGQSACVRGGASRLALARRLVRALGALETSQGGGQVPGPGQPCLLEELFSLVTKQPYSMELENPLSSVLLSLIHLSPESFSRLVEQWISRCASHPETQSRLRSAFEHLIAPNLSSSAHSSSTTLGNALGSNCFFQHRRPLRDERADFQQRFQLFAAEVRAFACCA
ncbi:unnamed protein product [Protopolystoma xenopodis]|uniref:Uncharacterized protein n=1 Tax=Protopolystoma xenopodis TaxID=117903 RepID=A0A3S5CKN9_9PLAT|nr:unnamed protein product [Protopolystoma xenopodis]